MKTRIWSRLRKRWFPLHRLRRTRFGRRLLKSRLNAPGRFNLGFEFPIYLRPMAHTSLILSTESAEPELTKLARSLFADQENSAGSFLDIGANIGWYSWLCRSVAPEMPICAFEPDPQNAELLRSTIRNGELKGIVVEEIALSDRKGSQSFAVDSITSATGTLETGGPTFIETQFGQVPETIQVQTRILDDFIDHSQAPAIIKIDVEGHEPAVLRGARRTLKIHRPVILAESFPPKREEVTQLLGESGYSIWDAETLDPLAPATNNLLAIHPARFPETLQGSIRPQGVVETNKEHP